MSPRQRRLRRWLIGVLAAVALYALIGFFLVPTIARRQIEQRASSELDRQVVVGGMYFNPFTFFVSVDELSIAGSDDQPLARWQDAEVNFDAFESLFRWEWRFGDVRLLAPHLRLVVDEAGNLNLADLVEPTDEPSGPPPRIGVDRLTVEGGSIAFIDRSRSAPFDRTIEPVTFTLENFSSKPDESGAYRLAGTTGAGESFDWHGIVAVEPFASSGRIEFSQIDLPAYMPFLSPYFGGEIREGSLSLAGEYSVGFGASREATVSDLTLAIVDVAVALPDSEQPSIELAELLVNVPAANLFELSSEVARIAATGLSVRAVRESDGTLDLATLMPAAPDAPADREPSGEGGLGTANVQIAEISFRDAAFTLIDRTTEEPAELRADNVNVTISGASTDLAQDVRFELGLRWAGGPGELNASGTVRPLPFSADLQLAGSQLQIAPGAPYLQQFANVRILSGQVELSGRVEAAKPKGEAINARWQGQLAVNELATQDTRLGHDLLGFDRLRFAGTEFALEPMRVSVEEVRLSNPSVNVLIDESGTINLAAAFASSSSSGQAPAEDAPETPETPSADSTAATEGEAARELPFDAEIRNVIVESGRIALNDQSVDPAFSTDVTEFGGTIDGLSTARDARAELDLSASIGGSAPVAIRGTVNLLAPDILSGSDVVVDLRGLRMELFETYVARYLGHRIEQGRMRGDFEYQISGDTIDGQNHVVLDQFFLGENVESPDAIGLPIKLALAVMRNRDGEIVLDVPVSGSLSSPEFSFGGAVRDAFMNSLSKVATAPFALLGSLFGAPDADLSQAEFPPGDAEFSDGTQAKLDTLARALQERPALELAIHWEPRPDVDRAALREGRLDELLAQERERLRAAGGAEAEGQISEEAALRSLDVQRVAQPETSDAPGEETAATAAEAASGNENGAGDEPRWFVRVYRYLFGNREDSAGSGDSPPAGTMAATTAEASAVEALSAEEMRERLLATVSLDDATFAELAQSRAQTARDYLIAAGVAAERVEVAPEPGIPSDTPDPQGAARISFSLNESSAAFARADTDAPPAPAPQISE